jgi:predicted DNA-binding transcriptional regulator YafY
MSFTGFKSLVIFSLLLKSPKSFKEVREYMLNQPYIREQISIDTFRVYLTSLKRAGCKIERVRDKEEKVSKYKIVSNPFELSFSNEQLNSIAKTYKALAKTIDIHELLLLEKFLRNVAKYNKDTQTFMDKTTVFKDINPDWVQWLVQCADKKQQIIIEYNSPNSGVKLIEILTDKVGYVNNKFYLYGTGFEYKQYGSFLINRIVDIKAIKFRQEPIEDVKEITVGFEVRNNRNIELDKNERLLGVKGGTALIEISSSNIFSIGQRLLSFGPDCKILYPEDFRQEFISVLQEMRDGYE